MACAVIGIEKLANILQLTWYSMLIIKIITGVASYILVALLLMRKFILESVFSMFKGKS